MGTIKVETIGNHASNPEARTETLAYMNSQRNPVPFNEHVTLPIPRQCAGLVNDLLWHELPSVHLNKLLDQSKKDR